MEGETADLRKMLDEPKSAILSMSLPLFVAFLISTVQLFVDSVWCSGLGPEASSAISVSGPVYWVIMDVGAGLGVGASTAIARALGAKDKARADSLASQMLAFIVLLTFAMMGAMALSARPILAFMSGGENVGLCMEYVVPYIFCCYALVMSGVIAGMLRAEGAARKSMALSVAASLINLVLDPVLIYGLGLGVLGASIATCASFAATASVGIWWYLAGSMYVRPSFKGFRFIRDQLWDIFAVGIPHTLELVIIPLMMMPQNALVTKIGGPDGIITYSLPFRFVSLAVVPARALSASMIPVASAVLGQKDYGKAMAAFGYTLRTGVVISTVLSFVILFLAGPLSYAFSYSEDMSRFHDEFTKVTMIYAFVTVSVAVVGICSGVLQTLRLAQLATLTIFVRECLFLAFYYVSTFISMDAVYWSLLLAEIVGAAMMAYFAQRSVRAKESEYAAVPVRCRDDADGGPESRRCARRPAGAGAGPGEIAQGRAIIPGAQHRGSCACPGWPRPGGPSSEPHGGGHRRRPPRSPRRRRSGWSPRSAPPAACRRCI